MGVVPPKHAASLPLQWSETQNVAWKTEIPHLGLSTPVVMEGKAWLTTATREGHDAFVLCIDAESGEVLLNKKLFHSEQPEPLGNNINTYASPSAVLEPGRAYISFGSTGTACLDAVTFETLWSRRDLPCRHYRGPGSSAILHGQLLILTMDGVDQQYLVALDKRNGQTVWKTDRTAFWDDLDSQGLPKREGDMRKAYSTPLVVKMNGRTQMISAGAKAAYGYDPTTGNKLWQIDHRDHSSSASLVYGAGMVYVMTGFSKAECLAIRVDGQGEVSDTHIAWRYRKGMPRTPSPVLTKGLLFTLADNGTVTCLNAKTGEPVWSERLDGKYAASMLLARDRLYCASQEGTTTVLKAGAEYKVLASNVLSSGGMASPAVAHNALFLRTQTHLYCIEEPSK
jgi:outer membrane protein assembly factor BamB